MGGRDPFKVVKCQLFTPLGYKLKQMTAIAWDISSNVSLLRRMETSIVSLPPPESLRSPLCVLSIDHNWCHPSPLRQSPILWRQVMNNSASVKNHAHWLRISTRVGANPGTRGVMSYQPRLSPAISELVSSPGHCERHKPLPWHQH